MHFVGFVCLHLLAAAFKLDFDFADLRVMLNTITNGGPLPYLPLMQWATHVSLTVKLPTLARRQITDVVVTSEPWPVLT